MSAVDDLAGELRRVQATLRSADADVDHAHYAAHVAQQTLLGIRGDSPCDLDEAIGSLAEVGTRLPNTVAHVRQVDQVVSDYVVDVLGCGDTVHTQSSGGIAAPAHEMMRPPRTVAHSVAGARRLTLALAQQAQMAEVGTPLAGAGTQRELRAAPRLAAQYGGVPAEWQKRSSSGHRDGGRTVETHWYQNATTGWRVEFKMKRP